ncbi:hypothetical protein EON79_06330 [bacterium]|nr:MAG: hypothetical protein EON79_06330 [bacterium]
MLATVAFLAAISSGAPQSPVAPSQREVNGFLVGQYRNAVTAHFGPKPFQTRKTEDGWVQRIYIIDRAKEAYMIFESAPAAPDTIYAIQITGWPGTPMLPFRGLKLGASREAVVETFGEPTVEEEIGEVPGTILRYEDRNYTLELSPEGRLASIRVVGSAGFDTDATKSKPDLRLFTMALQRRSLDTVVDLLTPDVEIYFGGKKSVMFKKSARRELYDPKSSFYRALFSSKGGVVSALAGETSEAEENLRVRDRGVIDYVFKFPKGKVVKEVVYKWSAGKWRVWEITLKK